MASGRKNFGKLIRTIAEEEGMKVTGFSGDWAFRLEKDGKVRFTVGYHFPLNTSAVKELCQDKCLTYDVLTAAGVPAAEFVKIRETASGAAVSFNVEGTFDLLQKGNRNGCCEIRGLKVTPETEFTVVNELLPYWEDRYSVALKSPALSFAIAAEDPKLGKKGSACVRLYVLDETRAAVDDLGKYTDTAPLTLWINP